MPTYPAPYPSLHKVCQRKCASASGTLHSFWEVAKAESRQARGHWSVTTMWNWNCLDNLGWQETTRIGFITTKCLGDTKKVGTRQVIMLPLFILAYVRLTTSNRSDVLSRKWAGMKSRNKYATIAPQNFKLTIWVRTHPNLHNQLSITISFQWDIIFSCQWGAREKMLEALTTKWYSRRETITMGSYTGEARCSPSFLVSFLVFS